MKIKGFTIAEVGVALALTSLVFILGWTVWRFVSNSFTGLNKGRESYLTELLWQHRFDDDIRKAITVRKQGNGILLNMDSTTVIYEINGQFFTRTSGQLIDSLIAVEWEVETRLRAENQWIENALVDEIEITNQDDSHRFSSRKSYTPDVTLKENH